MLKWFWPFFYHIFTGWLSMNVIIMHQAKIRISYHNIFQELESGDPCFEIINPNDILHTIVADVLVPNKDQAINKHHADLTMTVLSHESYCMTQISWQPLNKQCLGEVGKSATCWFLCYWQVCFLTVTMHYDINGILQTTPSNAFLIENVYIWFKLKFCSSRLDEW